MPCGRNTPIRIWLDHLSAASVSQPFSPATFGGCEGLWVFGSLGSLGGLGGLGWLVYDQNATQECSFRPKTIREMQIQPWYD
jgi:hypothetical protein